MGEQAPRLSRIQWWLACAWVVLALILIYVRGTSLTLDRNVTHRLRYHAMPTALSVLRYGHPHDYTAFKDLAQMFQTSTLSTDDALAYWEGHSPAAPPGSYFWAADDRGMADYIIASFALFGRRTQSLYSFYFVVLASSCALFVIGYWRQPAMTALLLFALAGVYVSLSVIPLASAFGSHLEPPSLFEPRILDLLAFVATVHLAFAAWSSERSARWALALAAQLGVFIFLYHARSSLGWEAAVIVLTNAAAAVRALVRSRSDQARSRLTLQLAATTCVFLAAAFVGLNLYKRAVYHPRYFEDMGARTIWHNALMGFGSNAVLRVKYGLGVDDAKIIDTVLADMKARQDPRLSAAWTNENIRNSLGGWSVFNWFEYESAARRLYFDIWRTHRQDALRCYFVDKPQEIASMLMSAIRNDGVALRDLQGIYFRPFGLVALAIALPGLVIALVHRVRLGGAAVAAASIAALSLAPGLLFYSMIITMIGAFASLAFAIYVGAAWVVTAAASRLAPAARAAG